MSYDELELDTLGDRKTALFLIMSDTDDTFNFVIAILQSQLFNLLCDKADDEYNGKLPVHVRFLLDEFANIGQIPRFDKLIATIRSREMSASIILQSQSQLKAIYKDAAEIILDNADSTLFLGGRGKNAKDISDNLGRETIDSFNTSENRGTQVSHGLTYQKLGKELMTQDEIAVMDGGKCILQLRGVRPFLSDKYDITKHPNYKYLSDFDKKNAFDVERYMSTRPAISGLLECGECGNAVTRSTINNGYKLYSYFRCSVRTKENRCELKQVPEAQVEAAVLQLLQEHISAVVELDRCLSEIQQVPYQKINVAKCEQRREKLAAEIARYRDLKASLYEDMKEGLISKTDFCDIRGQYDARIADALIAQEQIDRELSIYLSGEQSPNNWMKTFTEHRGLKSLTRAVVLECIEKVVIHKDEKLEIIFEHSEDYARLVSSLQEYAARGILGEAM